MSQRATTWLLFAAMAVTVPLPYFMFVIAGLLPLVVVLWLMTTGGWGFKLFNAIHLVIYAPLLYMLAWFLARRLGALPARVRTLATLACALAIGALGALPLYGVGHNVYTPVNLYRLFQRGLG